MDSISALIYADDAGPLLFGFSLSATFNLKVYGSAVLLRSQAYQWQGMRIIHG
jgi:hypothetical protein